MAQLLAVGIGVTFATFVLIRIVPGDPAVNILGVNATPASLASLRRELHLNVSVFAQLWLYVKAVAHGSLGTSIYQSGLPVTTIIGRSLPVTAAVIGVCLLLSLVIGIPVGVLAGVSENKRWQTVFCAGSITLLATPPFLMGVILLFLVAVELGLAPAGGYAGSWPENLRFVWLPAVALAGGYLLPLVARTVWQSSRETWQQPFIRQAWRAACRAGALSRPMWCRTA